MLFSDFNFHKDILKGIKLAGFPRNPRFLITRKGGTYYQFILKEGEFRIWIRVPGSNNPGTKG